MRRHGRENSSVRLDGGSRFGRERGGTTLLLSCPIERARHSADEPVKLSLFFRGIFESNMSPLALAAGQHHLAIKDLVPPNSRDSEPIALGAKIGDLSVTREGNRLKPFFARFVLRGSNIKCQRSSAARRNEAVTRPTRISALKLPISRDQRRNVTAAPSLTGEPVSTGSGREFRLSVGVAVTVMTMVASLPGISRFGNDGQNDYDDQKYVHGDK